MTTDQIRNLWIKFFKENGHHIEESQSLMPVNDDTLLFINSGVAVLKKYFDGSEKPFSPKIANVQKAIRTNDIENVGVTSRHQTLFEMLGNFSIGDYFKVEAIDYAYEFLTNSKWLNIPIDKLYFTVHPEDSDTFNKWIELGIKSERIIKTIDNFWEIGQGPGGPNTEIFFDRGQKYDHRDPIELLEEDLENDRIIEIWNIVFSEYNCQPDSLKRSDYKELPQKNIDTGLGLERLACIMQDVETNFETDNFQVIISEIEKYTKVKYQENKLAFRVIADHIRAIVFAISDGIMPSNESRGYVIRRLIRRSLTFAQVHLEINEGLLTKLIETVIKLYQVYYTHLVDNQKEVKKIIFNEEQKFLTTLESGLLQLNKELKNNNFISAAIAFKLYDTYGFPIELTQEIAMDKNIVVDMEGFKAEMDKQKARARSAHQQNSEMAIQNQLLQNIQLDSIFVGYDDLSTKSIIILITDLETELRDTDKLKEVYIILDKTPFYAESGGQVADVGTINGNIVIDVQKITNGQFLHKVILTEPLNLNQEVYCQVDLFNRQQIAKNHSATHLLHLGLEKFVGKFAKQAGSYQDKKRIRFDFTNPEAINQETINLIEQFVNQQIQASQIVEIKEMKLDDAKKIGANALFGEKYQDDVRVVKIGDSIELCGGTHVKNTLEIERFKIISEVSIGSGVRRIEALTSSNIDQYAQNLIDEYDTLTNALFDKLKNMQEIKLDELEKKLIKIKTYQDFIEIDIDRLELDLKTLNDQLIYIKQKNLQKDTNNILKLKQELELLIKPYFDHQKIEYTCEHIEMKLMRELSDQLIAENENLIVILKNISDNKIQIIVKCSKSISNNYSAKEILNSELKQYNGKGGGNNQMAQGGGVIK